jgi:DAPG hydrolase PhiG domain
MSIQERLAKINGFFTNWVIRISKGETKDLVIDHEIVGVTPEMIDMWWAIMSDTETYRLWHPKDHIRASLEINEEAGKTVLTQHVLEKIGGIPSLLHLRMEDPSTISIPKKYSHIVAGSSLSKSGTPYAWTLHQYEEIPGGTRMRSTFRIPAKAPGFFVKGLRKHNQEEMAQFSKFLPKLYEEKIGQRNSQEGKL